MFLFLTAKANIKLINSKTIVYFAVEFGFLFSAYKLLLQGIIFLMVSTLFLVVIQSNPVFAVFSFISTAFCAFLFFIIVGAEFFALLIIIIYTGVITVLFLFVVIMYNLRVINLAWESALFNPVLLAVFAKIFTFQQIFNEGLEVVLNQTAVRETAPQTIMDVVGLAGLFNDHYFLFLFTGLLIFISMVGSIVITYPFYKHQQ